MKHSILFTFLIIFLLPQEAFGLSSDWQRDEAVSVRLISGVDGVGQEKTIPLGLDVELAPDWHTYWRSPGAAGLPPDIDWQNSKSDEGNLLDAQLLYPTPKRYTAFGLETIGYRDHIVFPIDATVRVPGHALAIDASLNLLVCSAVCVPKTFGLKLLVPVGAASESVEAGLLSHARDQLPGDAVKTGLLLKSVENDGQHLIFQFETRTPPVAPDIFIEDDKNISFDAPKILISSDWHKIELKVKPADTLPEGVSLAGMALMITAVDGDHAIEAHIVAPSVTAAPALPATSPMPLGLAVLFALIGGFILNLMPCVLPVLSLKVLGAVGHGGGEARLVRQSFLMTAAGILFSFLVLACMTLVVKEFGLTLGWGVQFQQPVFLAALILILVLFAANMWGLFDIGLPRWLADNLSDAAYHPKLAGDFATGAFATLLATPCTAPFLGTAVGFALAGGPRDILVIFAALGFGMVLPYLAIAIFPGLATALPKPGRWMLRLRHLLGWALALTAAWLIWVLAAQITTRFALLIGLCVLGVLIILVCHKTSISKILLRLGLMVFVVVILGVALSGTWMPKPAAEIDRLWLPYTEAALAADVDENKTVFVDVTADWCLTCKANKKFILSQDDISQRLFHSDVIALQADWTNPDPAILDLLKKYGRFGIPFNIVFGPGAPQGIVLPELLRHDVVMKALDQASKPTLP